MEGNIFIYVYLNWSSKNLCIGGQRMSRYEMRYELKKYGNLKHLQDICKYYRHEEDM